jgi:uncharacterized membrane protein HdeD (DUF308 family)
MSITKYFVSGILFIVIVIMGFIMKGMGIPLNTAVFTLHKLIALAFVVYTVINVVSFLKKVPANGLMWAMAVVSGLLSIALFATGTILSFKKPADHIIYNIHNISTILLVIFIWMTYYIAAMKK